MVDKRCAMIIVIRPFVKLYKASCTSRSEPLSKFVVASTSNRILGFRKIIIVMANRCFCPPDNLLPSSPLYRAFFKLHDKNINKGSENLQKYLYRGIGVFIIILAVNFKLTLYSSATPPFILMLSRLFLNDE